MRLYLSERESKAFEPLGTQAREKRLETMRELYGDEILELEERADLCSIQKTLVARSTVVAVPGRCKLRTRRSPRHLVPPRDGTRLGRVR